MSSDYRSRMLERIRENGPELSSRDLSERDVDQPLTEKQTLFVRYMAEGLTQTASARMAGYSSPGTDALALMKNSKIQHALAAEREKTAKTNEMTKKKVIDGFKEAIDMARTQAEPNTMINGWREIGRMCGFYEPTKTDIRVSVEGKALLKQIEQMDDQQLLEELGEGEDVIDAEWIELNYDKYEEDPDGDDS